MDFSVISDIMTKMTLQLEAIPVWMTIITVVIAALNCFLGYRLMKVWIAVIGFIGGGSIGYFICAGFVNNLGYAILAGFLSGLAIAFIAYKVYLIGVWMLAFMMVLQLVGKIQIDKGYWQGIAWIVGILLAVVVGFTAVKFVRPVIIISSGVSGAVTVVTEVLQLMGNDSRIILSVGIVTLAALGILIQFQTTKVKTTRAKTRRK